MKSIRFFMAMVMLTMLLTGTGCQHWRQKYQNCAAEKENLEALFESAQRSLEECSAARIQMGQQLNLSEQQKKDLQAQLAARKEFDPGFAGEDAKWDPSKGTITVTLESGVLFDSGKATLKSAAKARINRIAGEIKKRYRDKDISVVGHTDTDPIRKSKWKDNWELSAQRSLTVTRYLVDQGISAKQLIAAGRGEFYPIGKKKAENRRVEIVVHMY